jgi:hypothetical protein
MGLLGFIQFLLHSAICPEEAAGTAGLGFSGERSTRRDVPACTGIRSRECPTWDSASQKRIVTALLDKLPRILIACL